ncbi:MAG: HNH endonuclease [Cytophagales bacterium]|nr:HNH endonuclease [Cytophagales bacterium]|tara:strand:- start:2063 stop:2386 length:324 start_codon:yes stop_codon:yes gene_type:complete
MSNRWGIPKEVEDFVKQRDKSCVYCGQEFRDNPQSRKHKPSWEHIVNDIRINDKSNISLCCMSCNASKGAKLLEDWLNSDYCNRNEITEDSVAQVVKDALKNIPKLK